jgi:hypothetical protein
MSIHVIYQPSRCFPPAKIPFRRDNTTTDGSTTSRSRQGQYASAVTGVLFDIVYGYDTESASHQSLRAATGDSAIEVKGGPDRDSSIKSPAREQRRARPI